MKGEFEFIENLRKRAQKSHPRTASTNASAFRLPPSALLLGIGDDAALFAQTKNQATVITTDLLIEDVDFRRAWNAPYALGWKSLAVSLSDVAAMGATPLYALTSLGIPPDLWLTKFVEKFYAGWFALANKFNVALIGGDISRTPERIVIDSIALGAVKPKQVLKRAGANAGDYIFVTGALGGAAAGLHLLEQGARLSEKKLTPDYSQFVAARKQTHSARREQLLRRQLMPQPRLAWGAYLAARKLATAALDVSDGLSSDLAHLCAASGVGAEIDLTALPIDTAFAGDLSALKLSSKTDANLTFEQEFALHGGEDFELLFTVAPRRLKQIPAELEGVPARCIGRVVKQKRIIVLNGGAACPLVPRGFTHF